MKLRQLVALGVLTAAAACAQHSAPVPGQQASIPFGRSQISTWAVANDKTVYVQSINGQWYRADLMNACFELPFAETIGFRFSPDGSFDKFSSIRYRGQECQVRSLTSSGPPPKRQKLHQQTPTTADTGAPAASANTAPPSQ